MTTYWVIDTKCKVQPESTLPQDGSAYYYGRSVVPSSFQEQAITLLTEALKEDHTTIEEILNVVNADDGDWLEDDEFEVLDSIAVDVRADPSHFPGTHCCDVIRATSTLFPHQLLNLRVGAIAQT